MAPHWRQRVVNVLVFCGLSLLLVVIWHVYQTFGIESLWVIKGKEVIETVFSVYILSICVLIFLEQRNPAKTLSWLLVFIAFPILGFVMYILLGQNLHKRLRAKRKRLKGFETQRRSAAIQRDLLTWIEQGFDEDPFAARLRRLLLKNSDSLLYLKNRTETFVDGTEAFEAILKAIEAATNHIHLSYFIIRDDVSGNRLKKALIQKAKEGVMVRLIYDSVGSWRLGRRYLDDLKQAGVQTVSFFPVVFPFLRRTLNYRNHRKILVVDGRVGFIGGQNIGDEYLGLSKRFGYWRDSHLRIEGEAVFGLQTVFLMDWEASTGIDVVSKEHYAHSEVEETGPIQIVASGPDSEWEALLQAYCAMIMNAKDRVFIATPYLVPDAGLLLALKTAVLSGVDIRILIPEKPDHFFSYWATQSNLQDLLKAGVTIYRYQKGFMHSKVILADGECATVGSANFDMRSMEINFEINAFLYDKDTIQRLESQFLSDLNHSKRIYYEQFLRRPYSRRILEALGRLVSPLQ